MHKFYKTLLPVIIGVFTLVPAFSQHRERCSTVKAMEAAFQADPSLKIQYDLNEIRLGQAMTREHARRQTNPNSFAPAVTIPIVFHVVLTAAQQANVTDAMIMAQLNTLNKDYTGFNGDSANVPPPFQALRGHSTFSFCLAARTPAGLATTGINRVVSTTKSSGSSTNDPIKSTAAGGADAWNPNKYVNIWLTNFTNASLLGYASFPIGSPENGGGSASQQGVVVLAQSVPGGTEVPYNQGRTLTHELGHFFWLRHVWGDGGGCQSDFPTTTSLDDTPTQSAATFGCAATAPSVSFLGAGCTGVPNPPGKMFQNYMDYTDDGCMTMFTNGQLLRSEQAINTFRPSLLTSDGCVPPFSFSFSSAAPVNVACAGPASATTALASTGSTGFTTPIVLTYSGAPAGTSVSFSVNPLAPGSSTDVTLNNTNTLSSGTYNITITGTAGTNVQNTTVSFVVLSGTPPSITTQPSPQSVCVGSSASFIAAASAGTYQWQVSTDGVNWNNISGATSATYTIPAVTAIQNGYLYHAVAGTQCANATTSNALLTVTTAPAVTAQPAAISGCTGSTVSFTAAGSGSSLTYQWQVSTDGGGTWTNVAGATSATLQVPNLIAGMNNNQYHANISNSCATATSAAALLTVNNTASITTQPVLPATTCAGTGFTMSVAAVGTGLSYQWQVSANSGTTWNNIPGATGSSYTFPSVVQSMDGSQYQVIVSSTCTPTGTNSDVATLHVFTPVTVNQAPPVNVFACVGEDASLTVDASGTGLTYQWQVSHDNGASWTDISGATTSTYVIHPVNIHDDGNQYQVTVTPAACGFITTPATKLHVSYKPGVVLAASRPVTAITPGTPTRLYATVSPYNGNYSFEWTRNNQVTADNTNSIFVNNDNTGAYTVKVTDLVSGCSIISNRVELTDSVTNNVFVYPNPNSGHFVVRYYGPQASEARTLAIYDSKGGRVYFHTYDLTSNTNYQKMEVNMTGVTKGIYMVEVRDASGNRLGTSTVLVK